MALQKTSGFLQRVGHASLVFMVCVVSAGHAWAVELAQSPLFIGQSVDPNIMFILDDSGSMQWEYMPDGYHTHHCAEPGFGSFWCEEDSGSGQNVEFPWYYSGYGNPQYFDPGQEYQPPIRPDGSGRLPESDYNNAWMNGYCQVGDSEGCEIRDLEDEFEVIGGSLNRSADPITFYTGAFYWDFDPNPGHAADCETDPRQENEAANRNCYTYVSVNDQDEEKKQRFANWYSYYRNRLYASRAGIAEAFSVLPEEVRVGWGAINQDEHSIDGVDVRTVVQGVRVYDSSHREEFHDWLYQRDAIGGTPLREALEGAGEYYEKSEYPWRDDPENEESHMAGCRQSYTVLMTDGYYSDSASDLSLPSGSNEAGDIQGEGPLFDIHEGSLAHVAWHYWSRDLRDDMANLVPTRDEDFDNEVLGNPAHWQHMVTYGVGLGVSGDHEMSDVWRSLQDDDPIQWSNDGSNEAKLDDLLHAGVTSRGGFFTADEPDVFAEELQGTLREILERVAGSSTSVAANSTRLDAGSRVYQALFDSADWSGDLRAFGTDSESGEVTTQLWSAAEQLDDYTAPADRTIMACCDESSQSPGVEFEWDALPRELREILADDNEDYGRPLVNWLRGDDDAGTDDMNFRSRGSMLGDIVNSEPVFTHDESFGHGGYTGAGHEYRGFVTDKASRPPMVYVGANDGMLHGFNAETGENVLSYVPGMLLGELRELAEPDYAHRYYVDGSPSVGDVHIDGQWRTILVGSLGAGGRGVFALDISDPENFNPDDVLWEFTHDELGEGVQETSIVRMSDGDGGTQWAVVFGNGYNSDQGRAQLFALDAATGDLLEGAPVDTGEGNPGQPNGLSVPLVIDSRGDRRADRTYAGDLYGNLWKFVVNDGSWELAPLGGGEDGLLFQASDEYGDAQPITAKPQAGLNRHGDWLVLFGTGKYLEQGDLVDDGVTQSLYGIIDRDRSVEDRNDNLLEQEIEGQDTSGNLAARGVTDRQPDDAQEYNGWYLDLDEEDGERIVNQALFFAGVAVFSTLIPSDDPCGGGGNSWIMALDAETGGRLGDSFFDVDGDGEIDDGDFISIGDTQMPASGIAAGVGVAARPAVLFGDEDNIMVLTGSDGRRDQRFDPGVGDGTGGRRGWRQLR